MTEIIIHVGLHKTASSSIQASLYENRELLDDLYQVYYPTFGTFSYINHSVPIYALFSENPSNHHTLKILFHGKNKKRIDTVVDNIPQSVIIDYKKQTASYIWPKTFSYLTIKLNPKTQKKLKEATKIVYFEKIKSDFIHGFETDIFKIKLELIDGTSEESIRWITKHGITLREKGIIDGKEGKIEFLSEFSNVRVFKQDQRVFEIPEDYTIAPMDQLDDINELLKLMVKRI